MEYAVLGAEQPDLLSEVPAGRRAAALEATRVATLRLPAGPWAAEELHQAPGHLGFMVLDGLLSREVWVGRRSYLELLGAGDVLRPWAADAAGLEPGEARWSAHGAVRLGVLDPSFTRRIGTHPEVTAALLGRAVRRSHGLAFNLAVAPVPQLEARLRLVLWHMAERWGEATPDGVILRLPLGHELLGHLVGAHRAAVTRAVGRLRAAGEVTRNPDGSWLIRGTPPDELGAPAARAGEADVSGPHV